MSKKRNVQDSVCVSAHSLQRPVFEFGLTTGETPPRQIRSRRIIDRNLSLRLLVNSKHSGYNFLSLSLVIETCTSAFISVSCVESVSGPVPVDHVQVRFSGCIFRLCCKRCFGLASQTRRTERGKKYCAAISVEKQERPGKPVWVNMHANGVVLLHHLIIPNQVPFNTRS